MQKTVLTFGLIAGALLSLMMVATLPFMDRIGFDKAEIIGYTSMVAAFLMVYFGVRSYRDNVAGGTIGFGRAFAVGLLITLVASACYVATWQVMYARIGPKFVAQYMTYAEDKARKSGASEDAIAKQKAEMAKMFELYKNPLVNIAITFLEPLPVGLLFSLGTAWGLSRRKKAAPALP